MKSGDELSQEFSSKDRVPAMEVVQACIAACSLSRVDFLQCQPPSRCSDAGSLALWLSQHLLVSLGEALCRRRPPKLMWHVLLACWNGMVVSLERKMEEKQRSN